MKVSHKWLQTFFEEGALPSVCEVEQKLMFHAYEIEGVEEINGDSIIDVDVLPNRAADSLSHRGIAREISTLFEIPMKHDPLREEVSLSPETDSVNVTLSTDDSCSYYTVAHITGVDIKDSPDWLKERLEAIGQKSINNVVDATNYVLFNIGQPTHVFDANKLSGEKISITTRLAHNDEEITLLGGEEVKLNDTITIVTDANVDKPLAIAGVKGGTLAEVDKNTTDIIIESAHFHPTQTRLSAQTLKLRTDASARFENNMSDNLTDYGITAVVELVLKIAGGDLVGYKNAGKLESCDEEVVVSVKRISKILGTEISKNEIEDILTQLQFEYSFGEDEFKITAPFERRDIKLPEDIIEEIGRVYGYEKIKGVQLETPEKKPKINKKFAYAELIRKSVSELGFTEVYLYSLRNSGEVRLRNALASDKDYLRSNLADGLVESLQKNERNMPLLGLYDSIKIFEIGNIFLKDKQDGHTNGVAVEETHVCVGVRVAGKKKKEERTKEVLVVIKDKLEEVLGVTLPEITSETLEFNLDELVERLPEFTEYPKVEILSEDIVYNASSQYPFVLRDIAVWVPSGVTPCEIKSVIERHSGNLLKRSDLFDEFEKDGKKSFAFHLVFQSVKETLTDEVVGKIMDLIENDITQKEGWEIR